MAKIDFNVTTNTDEVVRLREEIEKLKQALQGFDATGDLKGFDELNKKYQEATEQLKKYEQEIAGYQRIMEQMNLSSGVADSARQITAELNNATDVFVEQQIKVKDLDKELRNLNKSYIKLSEADRQSESGQKLLNEIKQKTAARQAEAQVLKDLKKVYTDNMKMEDAAADSLVALRLQLSALTKEYDRLSAADRGSDIGSGLQKQIAEITEELNKAEQATGRFQRNVGNYASAWNGLGVSVQQVARELPSLAVSANTFFLSISNNLPMLADELKKASAEYKAFQAAVKAGQTDVAKVAPVWKQLVSSIFSWQTALVVAITLLSTYAKDIISFTKSLFGLSKEQQRLNEALKEFNQIATKSRAEADLLFNAVTKTTEGTEGRARAIREINKAYGEYLPYLISEKASLSELEKAYQTVNKALLENAAMKAKTEAVNKVLEISVKKQAAALTELRAIASEKLSSDELANNIVSMVRDLTEDFRKAGSTWQQAWQGVSAKIQSEVGASKLPSAFYEELDDYVKSVYESNKEIEDIQKKFNPFFDKEKAERDVTENKKYWEEIKSQAESALESISADQKKLLDAGISKGVPEQTIKLYKDAKKNIQEATEALKAYDSYEKKSKDAEKETKKAEKEAEKQRKVQNKLYDQLLELRIRNQESEIELMEEGTEKKLAQIDLEYDKAIAEIKKRERDWKDAQGGILTADQEKEIRTSYITEVIKKTESEKKVKNDEFEKEKKALNEYYLEYGNFQEKKMALAVKYSKMISEATTEGERMSLSKEWDKELAAIQTEANKGTNAITQLFANMKDKTLKELLDLSELGAEALKFLQEGAWDENKGIELGITKEQFDLWKESPEKLKDISDALNTVQQNADNLRPAFDKVSEGLKRFFDAGDDAKKLEEALQLINNGVSEITSSVGFLSDTFGKLGDSFGGAFEGIADGLNVAMDAVNSAMSGAQAGAIFGPIGASAGAAIGVVTSLASAIAGIHDKKVEKNIEALQDQIDVLDSSYEKLGRSIEKAYSTDASKLIDQQNELLEQQKLLIEQQIAEEQSKKKPDDDRVKEWQDQIDAINAQIEDNVENAKEAISGISFDSFRDSFLETLSDMDSSAEDFAADFESLLQKSILNSLIANKYDQKIKQLYDRWANLAEDGLSKSEVEALQKEQQAIVDQMIKDRDELANIFGWKDELEESQKEQQTVTAGGFETMSQDSADELNGRFTALQITGEELLYIARDNQLKFDNIAAGMESVVMSVNNMYAIADENRTIIVNCYMELQQINDNTANAVKQLKEAVTKLSAIQENTNRL